MRRWDHLEQAARRVDAKLTTARGAEATIADIDDQTPLVTVSVGSALAPADRDRVLRAAVAAALLEMRRRGA